MLWPTLSALWLAANGAPSASLIVIFTLGTILMRSAGCAVNDWADRRFDAHVERTAGRPLATGEIEPWEALVVAAVLALLAFLLVLATNRHDDRAVGSGARHRDRLSVLQALLRAAAGVSRDRVLVRDSDGVRGRPTVRVPAIAWWLLLLNLFWVVAYDTEYAMVDRDDDVRLGLRTSAIAFGRFDVVAMVICYAIYLGGMVVVGMRAAMGPLYYAGLAVALGCARVPLDAHQAARARRVLPRVPAQPLAWAWPIFAGVALDYAVRLAAWPRTL